MTLMLASVANAEEAALVSQGGADIVDFMDPRQGAIGAAEARVVACGARAVAGAATISAAMGDPPYEAESLAARAGALRGAGADMLRLAVDRSALDRLAAPLARLAGAGALIGVMFADEAPDFDLIPELERLGFSGAALDTRAKGAGRLLTHLDVARLSAFTARCQELGLTAGLAGSLEPPDIPRLRLASPDVLGFRGALCAGRDRLGPIAPQALALVRDLIPRERRRRADAPHFEEGPLASGRAGADPPESELDRIFVRDFVAETEIGAYNSERGRKQRVAFDVEAQVARAEPRDMRAIFSYDVILDAIRIVLAQGHRAFVEELAEAVAEIVLRHERARAVRIVVRKLDVIAGSVGIEIVRRRAERR